MGAFAAVIVIAIVKGVAQIHAQHVADQQTRMKRLELKAKALEEERQIREIDAMTSRFRRSAELRDEAMSQLEEIQKQASDRDEAEYWRGVEYALKGALLLLGHPDSPGWEAESHVKKILDMAIPREGEEETATSPEEEEEEIAVPLEEEEETTASPGEEEKKEEEGESERHRNGDEETPSTDKT